MFHPASLLHECVDIVRRSGDIVREHWERPPDVRHKGRIDLVTRTDLAVEAFLKEKLGALLPEAAFLRRRAARRQMSRKACAGSLTRWTVQRILFTISRLWARPLPCGPEGVWSWAWSMCP